MLIAVVEMTVPVVVVSEEIVASVRGRPIWNYVFLAVAVLVSAAFASTLTSLAGDSVTGIFGGLALITCFILARVVHIFLGRGQASFLSTSLAAQFFLRGAVVSIFLAMVLEVVGMTELRPKAVPWKDLPIALLVGFSEEVAKMLSVIAGTVLIAASLPQDLVLLRPELNSQCLRTWTVLVESPRALAAAGIAVGFGFMMTENIEYFFMIFTLSSFGESLAAAGMRILLNLHPILTGLASSRLAKLVYASQGVRSISIGKVALALWPSIFLHALFDFGLMFASTNPEDKFDTIFIITSILIIPTALGLLVATYRALPVAGGPPLLAVTLAV